MSKTSGQPAQETLDQAMARFEGGFIESADLIGRQVKVTIEAVIPQETEKDSGGKLIDRPILKLAGKKKRLIVGKTNMRILKAMFGAKVSGWIGQEIVLGVRYLDKCFGERNVPTIRIIYPKGTPVPFGARKFFGSETPCG